MKAAVTELKASISKYLARVKRGNEVIVTERGQPIAKLVPFQVEGKETGRRREWARQGLLALGSGRLPADFLSPSPIPDPSGKTLKVLTEERESSW